jgi:hypothetical protein
MRFGFLARKPNLISSEFWGWSARLKYFLDLRARHYR